MLSVECDDDLAVGPPLREVGERLEGLKFGWVTDAWRAVVPGHDVLLIGLLVAFEATVGVMILSGGRLAQVGLIGAIGFHVCLALFFSWFFTIYGLAMLLPLVILLRAERHAAAAPADSRQKQPAQVGS